MNPVDPAAFRVEDDGRRRRYVMDMPNGEQARLTFVRGMAGQSKARQSEAVQSELDQSGSGGTGAGRPGKGKGAVEHWIADSTFVPVPYRGDGVAEALVERLIADARAEGATIIPTCWYVADEFARHSPEWDDVRAD